MTDHTTAAQAATHSVLTEAERHQLLVRANFPRLREEPRAYLVKITEELVLSKLRAPVADERDAARYRVLRDHTAPMRLAEAMGIPRKQVKRSNDPAARVDEMCDAALASAPVAEPYDSEQRCRAYYDSGLRPFITDGMAYNVWQAVWHAAQFDRAMRPNSLKSGPQSAPVAGEAQPVAWFRKTDITEWTDTEPETDGWTPLYDHAAPQASEAVRDAAFEAVRKRLCAIPRYSFYLDDDGVVRRVEGCSGNWIEFDAAHELFDPVAVDAALSAQPGAQKGGSDAG